jgi:hypothetical protein
LLLQLDDMQYQLQLALADAGGEVGFVREQLAEAQAQSAALQAQLDAAQAMSPHAVVVAGKSKSGGRKQKEFDENPTELEEIAREVASAQGALDELEGDTGVDRDVDLSDVEQRLERVSMALAEVLATGEDDAEFLVQQLADARQQLDAMRLRAATEPAPVAAATEALEAEAVEAENAQLKARLSAAEQLLDTTEYQLQLALAEASGERDFLARQLGGTQSEGHRAAEAAGGAELAAERDDLAAELERVSSLLRVARVEAAAVAHERRGAFGVLEAATHGGRKGDAAAAAVVTLSMAQATGLHSEVADARTSNEHLLNKIASLRSQLVAAGVEPASPSATQAQEAATDAGEQHTVASLQTLVTQLQARDVTTRQLIHAFQVRRCGLC